MKHGNAAVIYAQHGSGQRPAQRAVVQQAPGHVGSQPVKHWTPEAVAAMSLVGVVGLVTLAVCALMLGKLVRWVFRRNRCTYYTTSGGQYSKSAVVLTLTATAKQGQNGHDGLEVAGELNEDYHAHIRCCKECRDIIVTDIH